MSSNSQEADYNIHLIHQGIRRKLHQAGPTPWDAIVPITTDMDHFPYNRYFRGMSSCDKPRVFDREAGRRPWNTKAYTDLIPEVKPVKYEGCFQVPCSTILPCVVQDTTFKRPLNICVNVPP